MPHSIPPTLLLILDGWGQAPAGPGNAVSLAHTPNLDALMQEPVKTTLLCSGRAVGLPTGFMGNSEVGHMNIGAGRVVYQDMTRIDIALEDGSFAVNPTITAILRAAAQAAGRVHFMGLLSDGGVHSHINHLLALLQMAHKAKVPALVHAFMDGRDTSPTSGLGYMQTLLEALPESASVATVSGRFYAMDRDKRWERNAKAWQAIVHGQGENAPDAIAAIENSYAADTQDEFILPTVLGHYEGFKPGDAVFMFNFRADRMRQLAHAFFDTSFDGFDRGPLPALSALASMTAYEASLAFPVAFVRQNLHNGMGEVVAQAGLRQLRIAETEKYAHVTFFYNGGVEEPFANEERVLVPSPRDVPTYDLKPEMSAVQVTDALIEAWLSDSFDFVVCNLANLDMVGHTGVITATVKACEVVDACVGRIVKAVAQRGGLLVVTADHGNAEDMIFADGSPQTAHSLNPVACVITGPALQKITQSKHIQCVAQGSLGDMAPTLLTLWGMQVPAEMTGHPLCSIV